MKKIREMKRTKIEKKRQTEDKDRVQKGQREIGMNEEMKKRKKRDKWKGTK